MKSPLTNPGVDLPIEHARPRSRWPVRRSWLGLTIVVASALGCDDGARIRTYTISSTNTSASRAANRMLAAIVPHERTAWFFKVTGSKQDLATIKDDFTALVKSLRFDNPQAPGWDLPSGWTRRAGSEMRFATLVIPAGAKSLEVSVTSLTISGDLPDYLLANVNRWRDQMGQSALAAKELSQHVEQIEIDEHTITLVDIQGTAQAGPMSRAPFAGAAAGPSGGGPIAGAEPQVDFAAPSGWQPGQLVVDRGGMQIRRQAAFVVQQDDDKAEITITSLGAAAGALVPNIDRWRTQIGLPRAAAGDIEADAKQIEMNGKQATYVTLQGDQQTILGVIGTDAGRAWFVKLQGSNELASREQENFESFVRSIKIQ